MKKLLIAVGIAALVLAGCSSDGSWKKAQQENPLQIPPGMDRPATTNALTIPDAPTAKPATDGSTGSRTSG